MTNSLSLYRRGGFSLVELMVSVVVGMLALLFATRLITNAEINRNASLGGSDAMQNGMLALFSMQNDASQAGWGLNDTLVAGCDTVFTDANGYTLAPVPRNGANITPMSAVIIENGGANPDRISFYTGNSAAAVGSVKNTAAYAGGSSIRTTSRPPYNFTPGDVLLVAPEPAGAGKCALAQVASILAAPNDDTIDFSPSAAYRYNTAAGLGANFGPGQARIYNLGQGSRLAFHTWSVNNGILLLRATDLAGASQQAVSVIDNVVSIKAQYGFDTRVLASYDPAPDKNGIQVGQWSSIMINADNDADNGGAGDFQRIAAVRIAVVARSKSAEKPGSNGQCTATTVQPQVFTSAAPAGVAAVPIAVNVAVAGDPISWKCYRYRVFETIVSLRNAEWRP
ncbi:PilW family protein [Rugamonas apoptosis]|uniref:PilW family protein n=1 Tax=Rugamonas apoptosis TaxID=2758570 RepID=A0A7W2FBV5_9BURK|nr:PilW family protein [Rugamonas apoptosis]MBA5688775.1 PilW family protein [Rugamonas apoptosis]